MHACAARLDHAYTQICVGFGDAGALDFSSVKVAAVSINAVRSRLYEFAQPVSNQM